MSAKYSIGTKVKVNMAVIKEHDNTPPYISLVNSIIKDSECGYPEIVSLSHGSDKDIEIASWEMAALFKSAYIPHESCTVIS